jgi:hypothetical protein
MDEGSRLGTVPRNRICPEQSRAGRRCGEVNGRNSAGKVSISPFIGVLMGPDVDADFAMVGIGSSDRERTEVIQLCRDHRIYGVE